MTTYAGAHYAVKKERGRASGYACVGCGLQAEHWALINDRGDKTNYLGQRWSDNVEDFLPRCAKCHGAYDQAWHRDRAERAYTLEQERKARERARWHAGKAMRDAA